MSNKMAEVAKLLGVEIGEEFNILRKDGSEPYGNPHKITLEGLEENAGVIDKYNLHSVITGSLKIEKIPFKPKYKEEYYIVKVDGTIDSYYFEGDNVDYADYIMGNCFRTRGEAEKNKEKMLVKFKEIKKEIEA